MIFGSESDVYFQRRCRLTILFPYDPVLTKTKNKIVNNKTKTTKNCLKIGWVDIFHQNMALIYLMVSEKRVFTDGRRTDDGRREDDGRLQAFALLTQSSRTKREF